MSVLSMFYNFNVNKDSKEVKFEKKELHNTDKNITTFKFYLYKNKIEDGYNILRNEVLNYTATLSILNSNKNFKELTGVLEETSIYAIYSFSIPDMLINKADTYLCQLTIGNEEEAYTTKTFEYEVFDNIVTRVNEEIENNPDLPILKQLIQEVRELKLNAGSIKDDVISDESTWSSELINSKLKQLQEEGLIFSKETNADMWNIVEPKDGALCWVVEEGIYYTYSNGNWSECQMGGSGGGAVSGYISTTSPENIIVPFGNNLDLNIDFSSPNIGKGTLKVLINDVEAKSISISQGENTVTIEGDLFTKGNNKLTVYALDRTGVMTNDLTFTVRYGSTEIVSTFDSSLSYDYGSIVRYYFIPTAVDTSSELKFYMKIDDVIQEGVSCVSDTRGYYTFPNNLTVGNHYCEAWIEENGTTKSNILTFNLVILDESSLVINSTVKTESVEEGNQLSLDYRVYMKNNNTFNVKYYVDDELINTSTCTNAISYWTISTLTEGVHILKVVASDVTETVSDYVTWTINVTPSTYEMKTPVSTGSIALFTAKDRNNSDETRETWIGKNQDGENVTATLTNFAFNSDSGWIDNSLIISGDSYVEIPVKPLENNAKYGFTLDIEFTSKMIGVENAEVLTLWNETDNCGVKITTEQLIIRSKKDNECRLYFSDNEKVSVTFVIDRNEKVCKIFINGVMCQGFPLSDYIADGQTYLEDFTVDSNIILGGYGKNGYCKINNLRVYEVALSSDEVMNNFISNILDKTAQRNMVAFQTGDSLPTLTVTGDFAGLGKDDKKPCDVVFMSPDINLYGQSFTLTGKNSTIQYQGTSSMAYPIKNYKFKFKDKDGNKFKFKIIGDGQPESTITMKADFMSSGHWQNTGLAKWISDHLYHYDSKDEKSMNPMKWWSLQNGGSLSDTRETINGFPCRLILVNDGTGTLNEGQAEPTSGNTKDMGIFNFNLDKGCTDSFGLDNSIFSQCVSYEVSANSDTTAGAFVPYDSSKNTDQTELEYLQSSFELRYPDSEDVGEDYGFLGMTVDGTFSNDYGLKRVVDFVGNSTDEEFVNNFEEYFNKEYTFRYFLLVMTLAMVDNLGKNMMMDSWDGKIWYPRFYDLDRRKMSK